MCLQPREKTWVKKRVRIARTRSFCRDLAVGWREPCRHVGVVSPGRGIAGWAQMGFVVVIVVRVGFFRWSRDVPQIPNHDVNIKFSIMIVLFDNIAFRHDLSFSREQNYHKEIMFFLYRYQSIINGQNEIQVSRCSDSCLDYKSNSQLTSNSPISPIGQGIWLSLLFLRAS